MSKIYQFLIQDKVIKITVGILFSLGTLYGVYKTKESVEYNDLILEYKEQAKESRQALEKCLNRNQALMFENYTLNQERRSSLNFMFETPMARWVKIIPTVNSQPVMRYMNKAYEQKYLIPFGKALDDYEGKTDIQFWGEKLGSAYLEEDMRVIRTGRSIDEYTLDPFTKENDLRVIKYPITIPGGEIIGVGGVAIDPKNN